jgi:IclR family transcriptional regulator, acetate operon repressor
VRDRSSSAAPPTGVTVAPPTAAARGGVQSVDRALDLLETLASSGQPLGVSDLAALTRLPEGTAHRLLRSLLQRGYVRQTPDRKYGLGSSVLRLRDAGHRTLATAAGPALARLVEISGETANLAVLEGDSAVYVGQVPSGRALRMFAEVGRQVFVHCTAVGKVLVADLPERQVRAMLARVGMPARTPATITEPDAFLAELERVRRQGFAVDDGEEETGVRCLAVPVRDGGQVVAAVSVSGPADRLLPDHLPALAARLQPVADELGRELAVGGPREGRARVLG